MIFEPQDDLSIYEGIDKQIYINPFEHNYKVEDIKALAGVCPNIEISDLLGMAESTFEEYVAGEKWIEQVLAQINPEWTDVQKLAFVDNQIGKKISYSPEHGTEIEDGNDERCCWKIISSGQGVCNGISMVEQYVLSKIGIDSEVIHSNNHAYLMIKNIELPTADGRVIGDTLVDPTWNLSSQKYGAKPNLFCLTYEQIRELDIDEENNLDCKAHKSEQLESLEKKLISLDDKNLREVYKSIGLAREDGLFPITDLIDKISEVDKSTSLKEQLQGRIKCLKEYCPDFCKCMTSTMKILEPIVFQSSERFNYERLIVNRAYSKQDDDRKPVMFVYFDFGQGTEIFYYADSEKGEFVPMNPEHFKNEFECYDTDKELYGGKNIWETEENIIQGKEKDTGNILVACKERGE